MKRMTPVLVVALSLVFACDTYRPDATDVSATTPNDAATSLSKVDAADGATDDLDVERITAFVDDINAGLAASGSDLQLDYPWLFRIGLGTDPWGRLRTGSRWTQPEFVSYLLDESDYSRDVPAAASEATLVKAFETWNEQENTTVRSTRVADDGGNWDILDAVVLDAAGDCVNIIDFSSPTLVGITPSGGFILNPPADIIVGGWIDPDYFEKCLGSASILGVTWSFSTGDTNGDGYRDRTYVEEYYNPFFNWVTSGSQFLSGDKIDIESVVLHENGHAHGLGHFGGPINQQPFTLKPNGRVFNPEAVMNPFYLGGEKRELLTTDKAALRTLYARKAD